MAFKDCYKNLIYTLCSFSNWFGDEAKWIDSCDNSNDEDIPLYTLDLIDTAKNSYLVGNDIYPLTTTGAKCWPGSFTVDTLGGRVAHNMLMHFLKQYVEKEDKKE